MRPRLARLSAFVWMLPACGLQAEVQLPSLFSAHAVLMKSAAVPVWGKAAPGEEVTVAIAGQTATAQTAQDGRWKLTLDLHETAAGPFEMTVKGRNQIVIPDVVVGAVWLASGQSNMERILKVTTGAKEEIAASTNPLLREFKVKKTAVLQPADNCIGQWTLAGPDTSGDRTAVGYYFGKRLQQALKVPVGIINASWGGTFSEAWTSYEALQRDPDLKAGEDARRQIVAAYPKARQDFVKNFGQWLQTHDRQDKPAPPEPFAAPEVSTSDWAHVTLPTGKIATDGPPAPGAIWLRKDITIAEGAIPTGFEFKILLGRMEGFEQVYFNGKKVSETPYTKLPGADYPRYFQVPSELLQIGRNVLAVRIYSPALPPSLAVNPQEFKAGPFSLMGDWLAKREYRFAVTHATDLATLPKAPLQPPGLMGGGIFNGVINPLVPYALDGVIWYQGESNGGRAYQYRTAFALLIDDWRRHWQRSDLPFYFCQLANFRPKLSQPAECEWGDLRESQSAALHLPKTGQAVLIDLGESGDIHPGNKKDVGERLARIALANTYGQDVVCSGPVYESMKIEGSAIRLTFSKAEQGLVARPLAATYDVSTLMHQTAPLVRNSPQSPLEGFAICGEDHHWVWAHARIDGPTVVVTADQVPHPVAVRYAWADNPTCNLDNSAGLPASPFRTDDFPTLTASKKFGPGS